MPQSPYERLLTRPPSTEEKQRQLRSNRQLLEVLQRYGSPQSGTLFQSLETGHEETQTLTAPDLNANQQV